MRFLIDFPWDAEALAGPDGTASTVFEALANLQRRFKATLVPFFDPQELLVLYAKPLRGSALAQLVRMAADLGRDAANPCPATVPHGPDDLRLPWRCALYDEASLGDWRIPHVIIPAIRSADWHEGPGVPHLVRVDLEPCGSTTTGASHRKVLVILEDYDTHPHAMADWDPWDVQNGEPDMSAGRRSGAILPKPPMSNTSLSQLPVALDEARARGSRSDGKYYFLPSNLWEGSAVERDAWRRGQTFQRVHSPERNKLGYVDYEGHTWVWHTAEHHWDVQWGGRDNYYSVAVDGTILHAP